MLFTILLLLPLVIAPPKAPGMDESVGGPVMPEGIARYAGYADQAVGGYYGHYGADSEKSLAGTEFLSQNMKADQAVGGYSGGGYKADQAVGYGPYTVEKKADEAVGYAGYADQAVGYAGYADQAVGRDYGHYGADSEQNLGVNGMFYPDTKTDQAVGYSGYKADQAVGYSGYKADQAVGYTSNFAASKGRFAIFAIFVIVSGLLGFYLGFYAGTARKNDIYEKLKDQSEIEFSSYQ